MEGVSGNGELMVFVTYLGAVRKTAERCKQVLAWLNALKIKFTLVDLGVVPERRAEMVKISGKHELPQLFVDDAFIGGYDDVEDWVENEQLIDALAEAGVAVLPGDLPKEQQKEDALPPPADD